MGLKLVFLVVSRVMSLLRLSRRESWWKDAEILMLRHQLAVAERERPKARARLTWLDRPWLVLWVAENLVHDPDQQSCSFCLPAVMIASHVPAIRLSPDHACGCLGAMRPGRPPRS